LILKNNNNKYPKKNLLKIQGYHLESKVSISPSLGIDNGNLTGVFVLTLVCRAKMGAEIEMTPMAPEIAIPAYQFASQLEKVKVKIIK